MAYSLIKHRDFYPLLKWALRQEDACRCGSIVRLLSGGFTPRPSYAQVPFGLEEATWAAETARTCWRWENVCRTSNSGRPASSQLLYCVIPPCGFNFLISWKFHCALVVWFDSVSEQAMHDVIEGSFCYDSFDCTINNNSLSVLWAASLCPALFCRLAALC
jgi:hypothetical protein